MLPNYGGLQSRMLFFFLFFFSGALQGALHSVLEMGHGGGMERGMVHNITDKYCPSESTQMYKLPECTILDPRPQYDPKILSVIC